MPRCNNEHWTWPTASQSSMKVNIRPDGVLTFTRLISFHFYSFRLVLTRLDSGRLKFDSTRRTHDCRSGTRNKWRNRVDSFVRAEIRHQLPASRPPLDSINAIRMLACNLADSFQAKLNEIGVNKFICMSSFNRSTFSRGLVLGCARQTARPFLGTT